MTRLLLSLIFVSSLTFANRIRQGGGGGGGGAGHTNGANCSVGNYPLGVDANGAVESCTAAAGGGDVVGPAPTATTDFSVVRWNGVAGTSVEDSVVTIDDFGNASGFKSLSVSDLTAGTAIFADGSDALTSSTTTSTELALLTGVTNLHTTNGANCSANQYPLGVDADGAAESCTADAVLTQEQVEDFAGALVGDGTGTHTGIAVTYQDATGDVDLVVDHDAASNFLATEHVDWAGAGTGTVHTDNYVEGHANGANCSANQYPLGVDASGAVESCTADADTQLTQEQVEDFAGALIGTGGTKTGITITYQDVTNDIDYVVDDTTKVPNATLTTKGDIFVATGASTVTRLAIGTDTQVLTADSAEASGIKWAAAGGGGSQTPWTSNIDQDAFCIADATNEILCFTDSVASAVNYVEVTPSITTAGPSLNAAGSDTNIDLVLKGKGTGQVDFPYNHATNTVIGSGASGGDAGSNVAVGNAAIAGAVTGLDGNTAIGSGAQAGGGTGDDNATCIGRNCVAYENDSTGVGSDITMGAGATRGTAIGANITITGGNSVCIGYATTCGASAIVVGEGASATGTSASTIGKSSTSTGASTYIFGTGTSAGTSTNSVLMGNDNDTTNFNSIIAFGTKAKATADSQVIFGSTGVNYANWFLGGGTETSVAFTLDTRASPGKGTNKVGHDWIQTTGSATGNGRSGDFYWNTGDVGASGTAIATSTTKMKLTAEGHLVRSVEASIVAGTTQTQAGGYDLSKDINEISTVGTTNDAITLPSAEAGMELFIINNGANTLQIFPAVSDNLGSGVDTATTLASGSNITFVSYDATNWETK